MLYGPNDLGKSSLAAAMRAALLLQVSSREHEEFLAWDSAGDPYVELVFESEPQRIWRVKKTFGNHPQAFLEESRDGVDFHVEARGREVDGRLSEILRWGLAPPGPKGRPRGMPVTFLSTALMAEQDHVAAIFGQALSGDSDESGKKRLIDALHAAAEHPLFKAVLQQVQERFDEAFLSSGQRRRGKDSPWLRLREQIQQAEEEELGCSEQLQKTRAIETELQDLLSRRLECQEAVRAALEVFGRADDEYKRGNQRAEISGRLSHCKDQWAEITAVLEKVAASESRADELGQGVARLVLQEGETKTSLMERSSRAEAAKEIFRALSEDRLRERELKQATLERRKAEILAL